MAYQQRIRREVGALDEFNGQHDALGDRTLSEQKNSKKNNFWLSKTSNNTLMKDHNSVKETYVQQPNVLKHVRLNNGIQGYKDLKSRMIDSTYVNASDPNSMRDLG